MPLSEHEQRLFDQIEQSLAQDPKFASAVRATDPRFHARRRVIVASVVGVLGFGMLIAGPITKEIFLSVIGFIIAFGALIFIVQTVRHGHVGMGVLRSVGGTSSRRAGRAGVRATTRATTTRKRRLSVVDRLEERWRNRPEGQ